MKKIVIGKMTFIKFRRYVPNQDFPVLMITDKHTSLLHFRGLEAYAIDGLFNSQCDISYIMRHGVA